ncbi:hypothetical protein KEM55_004489 [Ascosphaera atra]|nr:hypothetical protein KEM55_004489 [Ascosphaera atra]
MPCRDERVGRACSAVLRFEAGVRRFIPSEWGTDPRETVSRKRLPQFAVKTTVYNHLVKLAEEGKIEFTTFATGPFLAPPVLKFFLAADIPSRTLNVWDEKKADIKISTTTVPAIGHAIAKSLTPELAGQFVNKPVFIHSASFTARTVRAAFEKATGSKWEVKNVDIDALLEEKTKALHEGDLGALRDVIRGVLLDPELQPDFEVAAGPGEETSEILGVPKADIEELVKQVVQEESS